MCAERFTCVSPMSEEESRIEYSFEIPASIDRAVEKLPRVLESMGLKGRVQCDRLNGSASCVLEIYNEGSSSNTINPSEVYGTYLFVVLEQSLLGDRTSVRIYSYEESNQVTKLVEELTKYLQSTGSDP